MPTPPYATYEGQYQRYFGQVVAAYQSTPTSPDDVQVQAGGVLRLTQAEFTQLIRNGQAFGQPRQQFFEPVGFVRVGGTWLLAHFATGLSQPAAFSRAERVLWPNTSLFASVGLTLYPTTLYRELHRQRTASAP
ncbi:hypothetical protein F0P96_11525 [Hymenobacter busanensis]|uniref:Uncharacterized protein n=1 Tax=Hymenobacter busanensis TaxID=2607656 RepID=A0A7L5A1G3_9BACT|nr:hypothetical protein [Hymenobacter busanensis]KAA9332111.1 hypothetical protein F0P96_11525 [Hymenobacter busanensis]QHJ07550.1 hypothetical protein GUY19_09745 [Hymenobacter busanensis]